jgi:hypothetical protein
MDKLQAVDALLDKTDRFEKQMHVAGPGLRKLAKQGLLVTRSLDSAEPAALAGLRTADTLLIQAKGLILALRKLARDADTSVQQVAQPLEPFTRNDSLLIQIQSALKVVDQVQAFLDGKAKIKYNFHVLGSNPSKHGE